MHWPKVPPSTEEKEEEVWMSTTCSPASAICRWVVVFPIAAKNYLRSEGGDPKELDGLLSTGEVDELFQAPNQCLYVLDTMRGLSASWAAKARDGLERATGQQREDGGGTIRRISV